MPERESTSKKVGWYCYRTTTTQETCVSIGDSKLAREEDEETFQQVEQQKQLLLFVSFILQ